MLAFAETLLLFVKLASGVVPPTVPPKVVVAVPLLVVKPNAPLMVAGVTLPNVIALLVVFNATVEANVTGLL